MSSNNSYRFKSLTFILVQQVLIFSTMYFVGLSYGATAEREHELGEDGYAERRNPITHRNELEYKEFGAKRKARRSRTRRSSGAIPDVSRMKISNGDQHLANSQLERPTAHDMMGESFNQENFDSFEKTARTSKLSHSEGSSESGNITPGAGASFEDKKKMFLAITGTMLKGTASWIMPVAAFDEKKSKELEYRRQILFPATIPAAQPSPNYDPRITHPFALSKQQEDTLLRSNGLLSMLDRLKTGWTGLQYKLPEVEAIMTSAIDEFRKTVVHGLLVQATNSTGKYVIEQGLNDAKSKLYEDTPRTTPGAPLDKMRVYLAPLLVYLAANENFSKPITIDGKIWDFVLSQFKMIEFLTAISEDDVRYLRQRMNVFQSGTKKPTSLTPISWILTYQALLDFSKDIIGHSGESINGPAQQQILYLKALNKGFYLFIKDIFHVSHSNFHCQRAMSKLTILERKIETMTESVLITARVAVGMPLSYCRKLGASIAKKEQPVDLREHYTVTQLHDTVGAMSFRMHKYTTEFENFQHKFDKRKQPHPLISDLSDLILDYNSVVIRFQKLVETKLALFKAKVLNDRCEIEPNLHKKVKALVTSTTDLTYGGKSGEEQTTLLAAHHLVDILSDVELAWVIERIHRKNPPTSNHFPIIEKLMNRIEDEFHNPITITTCQDLRDIRENIAQNIFTFNNLVCQLYRVLLSELGIQDDEYIYRIRDYSNRSCNWLLPEASTVFYNLELVDFLIRSNAIDGIPANTGSFTNRMNRR